MIDIRHLRAVLALEEHRNFHRAAESLSITQPALTLSIRKLEDKLGGRLFDRANNYVSPTELGNLVTSHGREILSKVENLTSAVDKFQDSEDVEVSFGIAPYVITRHLKPVLSKFSRIHPSVKPRLQVSSSDNLQAQLSDDQISFYIADTTMVPRDDIFTIDALSKDPITLVAKSDHPLCKKKSVSVHEFIQYPFVSASKKISTHFKRWFQGRLSDNEEFELLERNQPFINCDYYEATRALLLSTNYISGGARDLVSNDLKKGTLVEIPLKGFREYIYTGIVSRHDRSFSPATQALINCFKDIFSKYNG